MMLFRIFFALFPFVFGATITFAADDVKVQPPANLRFAGDKSEEVPDFQRHVLPLMGRLGCNGRACHGSFQGQGGFRLSLFGYDFASDHEALTGGESPRVDLKQPQESLILQKPTLTIDHEGGERFAKNSWQYQLIKKWVEAGAPNRPEAAAELVKITLQPAEIVFTRGKPADKDQSQLSVIAHWSDGSQEDVTPLSRFQTNDESVASVSDAGIVQKTGEGDTHIVAFYDNGIASVAAISPVSDLVGDEYPHVATPTKIDELVVAKLKKIGVQPSEVCSDAEFLRRVSLDLTGTLPTPEEVKAFLVNGAPDKRTRKVDELLSRPTYAAWMTARICDWVGNTEENFPVGGEQNMRREKSSLWYDWIHSRVERNTPYDEMVAGMVLAVSRKPEQSDDAYFREMSSYFREKNPADYTQRDSVPFFWSRGRFSPPQAQRFSYAFLGVRLECAECHKHPYDQWTQADYQDFQTFFDGVTYRFSSTRGDVKTLKEKLGLTADQDSGGYKRLFADLAHSGTVVPWGEIVAPDWTNGRKPSRREREQSVNGRVITPRLLGGDAIVAEEYSDPREPVMDWLRAKENPYFARVLVNRVWAGCFGTGLVNPTDDMNLANPASNEPLLDHLTQEFVASGFDLKQLYRNITASRTYQLSYKPNDTNLTDERNFSRALVRRLPAEVMYDAIQFATATKADQQQQVKDQATVRARQIGFSHGERETQYAMTLFGAPDREGTCDCQRSNEPSLLQTVYLRNDPELRAALSRKTGWLAELRTKDAAWLKQNRDALVEAAWLRTFSRTPSEKELAVGREQLATSENTLDGLEELLWALLNSKEFVLNH